MCDHDQAYPGRNAANHAVSYLLADLSSQAQIRGIAEQVLSNNMTTWMFW